MYKALKWITNIFNRLNVEYQIVGGLAAQCYGSKRFLQDIDFYVPSDAIVKLEEEVKGFIEFGPAFYKGEHWSLVFMKINYYGMKIEIADANNTKYFDDRSQQWIKENINFSESVMKEIKNINLPVMPKHQLIEYKYRLNRKVDKIDIKEIKKNYT